ncbi:MAG: hypothetical protein ACYDD4_02890 [Acidimicrobiales bacterium]
MATLLYAGHGVAVVSVSPPLHNNTLTGPEKLYLSTDLVHWQDITPPGSTVTWSGYYGYFEHASFLNPMTGWVSTFQHGLARGTIYATSDGGKTWTTVEQFGHSENVGATLLIQLVSPTLAFQEELEPTGPSMTLSRSTDGGRSWVQIFQGPPHASDGTLIPGPFEMPMTFLDAEHGFEAEGLPPLEDASITTGTPTLWYTDDGGTSWKPEQPPLPSTTFNCPPEPAVGYQTRCIYGLPTFDSIGVGVMPTLASSRSQATVAFDTTTDGGLTWTLRSQRTIRGATVDNHDDPASPYALVSVASTTTWWLLNAATRGLTTELTSDSGSHWDEATASAIPGANRGWGFGALNATDALLVAAPPAGQAGTGRWVTTDGGKRWTESVLVG